MEVQLARLCAHPEGCRRADSDALPDGDRHGARRMRDRHRQYRSVRKDDGNRIPRRRSGGPVRARSRRAAGDGRLSLPRRQVEGLRYALARGPVYVINSIRNGPLALLAWTNRSANSFAVVARAASTPMPCARLVHAMSGLPRSIMSSATRPALAPTLVNSPSRI